MANINTFVHESKHFITDKVLKQKGAHMYFITFLLAEFVFTLNYCVVRFDMVWYLLIVLLLALLFLIC